MDNYSPLNNRIEKNMINTLYCVPINEIDMESTQLL